jgi:hypothetical protein
MEPGACAQQHGANVELRCRALVLNHHGRDKDLAAGQMEVQQVLVAESGAVGVGLGMRFADLAAGVGSSLGPCSETMKATAGGEDMRVASLELSCQLQSSTDHRCDGGGSSSGS